MDGKTVIERASLKQRFMALCVFYVVFLILYELSGWHTSTLRGIPSFYFDFEERMPFLPWMIVPYMSSGLFFIYVFYLCDRRDELYLLFKRLIFVTGVAVACFFYFPLEYSFDKPVTGDGITSYLFDFLSRWDTPHNQAPSLHISYAFIFWSVIKYKTSGALKVCLAVWLILMGVATLTVYQHHLVDILAAFILVAITLILLPDVHYPYSKRVYRIAHVYYLLSVLFLSGAFFIYYTNSVYGLILIWPAVTLYLLGIAYSGMKGSFLKETDGTILPLRKVIYYPYFLIYQLLWSYFRTNKGEPVTEILPDLWIGARLSSEQLAGYEFDPEITIVYDLSAELEENNLLRQSSGYHSYPLLDIVTPTSPVLASLTKQIGERYINRKSVEKIYIHCTMGYTRSVWMGVNVLKYVLKIDDKEAIKIIKEKRLDVVLPDYLYEFN